MVTFEFGALWTTLRGSQLYQVLVVLSPLFNIKSLVIQRHLWMATLGVIKHSAQRFLEVFISLLFILHLSISKFLTFSNIIKKSSKFSITLPKLNLLSAMVYPNIFGPPQGSLFHLSDRKLLAVEIGTICQVQKNSINDGKYGIIRKM